MTGQVALIKTKNGPKVYISRDGMIAIAHRSGQLDGIVVDEERRSSRDDGWTCYVSVWRKDCRHPFRYGAQCKDSEPQAEAGNGPEMALARAERRALRRAFDIPADAFDPDPDAADHGGEGSGNGNLSAPADSPPDPEPSPLELGKAPRAGQLPADWPATPATPSEARDAADTYQPADPVPGRLQAAAHRTVGAWTAEKRQAFLDAHGIDDFGEVWPMHVVDAALEEPF